MMGVLSAQQRSNTVVTSPDTPYGVDYKRTAGGWRVWLDVVLVSAFFLTAAVGLGAAQMAGDGEAGLAIVCVPENNQKLKEAAAVLAGYLNRMSGAAFDVGPGGEGERGIVLCLGDTGRLSVADADTLARMGPEAHMIRVGAGRIILAGNSEKAVLNACHDFLERLGCRWLIPSERWTIVPKRPSPAVPDMVIFSEPDFAYRAIWYSYGMGIDPSGKTLARDYRRWRDGLRLGGVAKYKCGHTYGSTVGRHQEEFQAHPEYFAMQKDGTRLAFGTQKSLCYSNPRVAELFVEDKLAELRADKVKNPHAYAVSMDPNDSSVACCCETCMALGNGSDQTLYLANQVAKALRKEFPDAVATFYVYASHRLPPEKVKAEPNINVQVAMAFNRTKYSLEELVHLWRKTVSAIGIRDYFGVMAWDWGLPGRGKASSFRYVKNAIPKYKAWGATSYNSELNANWGTFGPAVYVSTKLLWDTGRDAERILDDFFAHAYGAGAADMKRLHEMWSESTLLSRTNLHCWFTQFDKAFSAAAHESPEVRARFVDMAAYLHYVRLFRDWERAKAEKDRDRGYEALKPLLEFTWRIRERQVVHSYALQRRLVNAGDVLIRPLEEGWHFKDPKAVWKHSDPLTDGELLSIYRQDLVATSPDTRMREFSRNLVPAECLPVTRRDNHGHL